MYLRTLVFACVYFRYVKCSVDVNLSQLHYIANHLEEEECRKLAGILHFEGYNLPNAAEQAGRKISEEISCIKLLLHYNSSPGEGKGKTHGDLSRRLKQIGRKDLADWLGISVYKQLTQDVNNTLLNEAFTDNSVVNTSESLENDRELNQVFFEQTEWTPTDTICWSLIAMLIVGTVGVLFNFIAAEIRLKRGQRLNQNTASPERQSSGSAIY